MADDKAQDGFIECVNPRTNLKPEPRITGTVNLIEDGEIILIPQPTADPHDPLNLPEWHKWLILVIVALSFYVGLGNLIAMPIEDAIGRCPVYLASNVILIVSAIWCSYSGSLNSHIGGRDFMALAAGQIGGSDDSDKVVVSQRRNLDFINFKQRSFLNGLKPWGAVKPQWKEVPKFYGALLGTYILMTAVFAEVLMVPPYSFNPNYLGFVMGGQDVVAFVVQPIAGYGSEIVLKYLTKRNNGVSEPEYRLIPAILPSAAAIVSCVIYGRSCQYPEDWAWTGFVILMNALFYSFVSIVRLHQFRISFGTTAFVRKSGYDGALNICAIVLGILTSFGFVAYFFGNAFRKFTQRWAVDS
ncbi:MFS general substrate transporter [Penicillium malachiteum]|nr:MFS general substrate transporter [Penicillium malachiteum]